MREAQPQAWKRSAADGRTRVLCVMGTRPEAIKMAPVLRELAARSDRITSRVCVTGQHREMLDQVLHRSAIRPDHDLDVMREAQSPTEVVARVMSALEPVIRAERPNWLLVQGDTTTTVAAALAAALSKTPVVHLEAGLRSHDDRQPFPEEINRRVTTGLADLHLAPTASARECQSKSR